MVKSLCFSNSARLIAFSLNYFSKKEILKTLVNGKSKLSIIDTCSLGNRQFIVVAQYESARHLLAIRLNRYFSSYRITKEGSTVLGKSSIRLAL